MKLINVPHHAPISVTVYRFALGDCTMNGVSGKFASLRVIAEMSEEEARLGLCDALARIISQAQELRDFDGSECVLVRRQLNFMPSGECHDIIVPLSVIINRKWSMMGGNYARGDSAWDKLLGASHPIAVHDRVES